MAAATAATPPQPPPAHKSNQQQQQQSEKASQVAAFLKSGGTRGHRRTAEMPPSYSQAMDRVDGACAAAAAPSTADLINLGPPPTLHTSPEESLDPFKPSPSSSSANPSSNVLVDLLSDMDINSSP